MLTYWLIRERRRRYSILRLPFIVIETTGMLMDDVRRDCIEERAIMGSNNRVRARMGKELRQHSHDDKGSGPCLEIIF